MKRPDLSDVSPEILAYIESLEVRLGRQAKSAAPDPEPEERPAEPPTPINVITISAGGMVKRTPRHHYTPQRRGGMGVFDIDLAQDDAPRVLALADIEATLLLFTDLGRSYRLPARRLPETEVRARGIDLGTLLPLQPGERVIAVLPEEGGDHVALVGRRGWVNVIRASFVGKNMIPGVSYYDTERHGPLAAACWIPGKDDLFIASRAGQAIRFPMRRVPNSGTLGIQLGRDDAVVGITAVDEADGVFLLGADGKGTVREMAGFRANQSPGGQGKVALKTDHLVAALTVASQADLFVITRLSKLIRFAAEDVPPKTGVVQGVHCIALRGDEAVAAAISRTTPAKAATG